MKAEGLERTMQIIITIALLIAMTSMFSTATTALGLAPSRMIYDFQPGKTINFDIDVVNNGQEELEVILYARGEFSDSLRIESQMLRFTKEQQSKNIRMALIMPENIEIAGPHEIDIVAVGSSPLPDGQKSMVKADVAVISKLIIEVPYPETYAEARIYVLDTEAGKPVTVSVPVFNKGNKDIESVAVKVQVYSADGALVKETTTDPLTIAGGKDEKFTVVIGELPVGAYRAVATVNYDGKEITVQTDFSVGDLNIDIRSLVVDTFTLGQVAKFDILLFNTWSAEIKNVYAEMDITDLDNNPQTSFKTVATDVPAQGIGRLEGYWYTQDVMPGVYMATITLHYANRVSQKRFELEVQPNSITARHVGIGGRAISADGELDLRNNSYLILIILMMAAVIGVLAFKLKKKKEKPTLAQSVSVGEQAAVAVQKKGSEPGDEQND